MFQPRRLSGDATSRVPERLPAVAPRDARRVRFVERSAIAPARRFAIQPRLRKPPTDPPHRAATSAPSQHTTGRGGQLEMRCSPVQGYCAGTSRWTRTAKLHDNCFREWCSNCVCAPADEFDKFGRGGPIRSDLGHVWPNLGETSNDGDPKLARIRKKMRQTNRQMSSSMRRRQANLAQSLAQLRPKLAEIGPIIIIITTPH